MDLIRIAFRVLQIGFLAIVFVAFAVSTLLVHLVRRDRSALVTSLGGLLARLAESLGPAAVKMSQVASCRQDLIPVALTRPLSRLQDRVKPPSPRGLRKALDAAYGAALNEVFEYIEPEPFACGSVAAVFRGRVRGGGDVAIKLVRPGTKRRIEIDLKIMRWVVSNVVARLHRFDGVPIAKIFDRFAELVVRQCDMALEAANATRLRRLLDPEVVIPEPLAEQSRPGVLVTTFISGTRKLDPADAPQSTYEHACVVLLKNVYAMIFVHGFVHGDLHPGNVAINSVGQVVLYDFGLVAELTENDRVLFRDFFIAVAMGDRITASQKIVESAEKQPPNLNRDEFDRAAAVLVKKYCGLKAGEFLVARFVEELFALQRRFGLSGAPGFANAVWALAMFEGLVRHGYPTLDFQKAARPFLMASVLERARMLVRV
ncbi:AarF/UbiB family protein [Mesorhizobium sp. M0040]|uniref:ABC1 kinase family protein n=1 Tax=Mesorhizobium sp. M0040 TaxID=2956855 RepID=UPI00333B0924